MTASSLNPAALARPSADSPNGEASHAYFRLKTDDTGATAIEYGLIAALIAVACIIAFRMLGWTS